MGSNTIAMIGAVVISALTVLGFTFTLVLAYQYGDMDTVKILSGVLAGAMTSVVGYWIGSSVGSRAKDEVIQRASENALGLRNQASVPNFPKTP